MHVRELTQAIDLLDLHRLDPARYPALFESTATGAHGRWDMLLVRTGESLQLDRDGVVRDQDGRAEEGRFLDLLDAHWQASHVERKEAAALPFGGGWALFLGYEMAAQVEPVLRLPAAEGGLPVACALRCSAAVLRDRASGECMLVAEAHAGNWITRIEADVAAATALLPLPAWQPPRHVGEDAPQHCIDRSRGRSRDSAATTTPSARANWWDIQRSVPNT